VSGDGEARAWGWVAHLRSGGRTPWRGWHDPAPPAEQAGRYLPGAQQLELLRRLNALGRPSPVLAERVLATSAPGRGRPDLGLVGVLPEFRFGPPPVDPAELPTRELVRVVTALIAEDVARAGDPAPQRPARLLRRRYRVLGDPELARSVREALIADRRPPGGRSAVVVVTGTDLASMLVHVWTARSLGAGARRWPEWVAGEVRRPTVLPGIDLAAVAAHWAGRVGPTRVHVLPGDAGDLRRATRLAGARRARPVLLDLSADAVELARRTGPVLGSLVSPETRTHLMWHRLRPVLAATDGPPLVVPDRYRRHLVEQTAVLRRRLALGNYAVHGELPDPSDRPGVTAPDEDRVLDLAMRLLLEAPLATPHSATHQAGAARDTTTEAGEDT
jgi:hypothetical protein